jgi:hypothetical protein
MAADDSDALVTLPEPGGTRDDHAEAVPGDESDRSGAGGAMTGARHALPPSGSRTGLTAWSGLAASVAAVVLVLAAPGHDAPLAGAFLLACVPAGAAVMCWVDSGESLMQAGLTLVLSLAVTAIASAVMIWLTAWHPRALLALAVAGAVSCAARLVRGTHR